jgi:hypothetical protein
MGASGIHRMADRGMFRQGIFGKDLYRTLSGVDLSKVL